MLTAGAVGGASAEMDESLRQVVREVEAHVASSGWDQPARLYALVPTSELLEAEPALAAALGLDAASAAGTLTPIEQEDVAGDRSLEELLAAIMWPPQVFGCAAVVERVVLPAEAEAHLPADSDELVRFATEHPGRHEVRMAAAVTRDGRAHCAVRLRAHDADADVLDSSDLVPTLVQLLSDTLAD